jgi:hypothetical protein
MFQTHGFNSANFSVEGDVSIGGYNSGDFTCTGSAIIRAHNSGNIRCGVDATIRAHNSGDVKCQRNVSIGGHNSGDVECHGNVIIDAHNSGDVECDANATIRAHNSGKVVAVSITYCGLSLTRDRIARMSPGKEINHGDLVLRRENPDLWKIKIKSSGNTNELRLHGKDKLHMQCITPGGSGVTVIGNGRQVIINGGSVVDGVIDGYVVVSGNSVTITSR